MADTFKGIITADGKKRQLPYSAVWETPVSDETLSIQGAFADAKVVGDKFKKTKVKTDSLKEDLAAETSRATAVEDTKADKTALARTDRSLNALWKLNQGVSYEFQTDEAEAYQKTVPSGAKLASVEKIGGRTLVWNQALPETSYINSSATDSRDTLSLYIRCITNDGNYLSVLAKEVKETGLKKYIFNSTVDCTMDVVKHDGINTDLYFLYSNYTFKANHVYLFAIKFDGVNPTVLGGVSCSNFQLFDLTRMFGPGNEPSTPEEFEAMFPADYYPYNEGELLSMPVNEVVEQGKNLLNYDAWKGLPITRGTAVFEKHSFTLTATENDCYTEPTPKAGFPDDAKIEISEGETVTLSWESSANIDGNIYIFPNGVTDGLVYTNNHSAKTLTYTATRGVKFITFRFGVSYAGNTISYKNIQIEKCSKATSYEPYHSTTHAIPQSILNLDGYGDGVTDNVYNYIDWENKKYYKRVGKVDLGTVNYYKDGITYRTSITDMKIVSKDTAFNGLCTKFIPISFSSDWSTTGTASQDGDNRLVLIDASIESIESFKQAMSGVMLYYELAEEQITDISDLIGDTLQEPIEVEAGGSLTFQNTHGDNYRIPVPNTVEYTVKLSEVAE